MFELLKYELHKLYSNKIVWLMLCIFFGMILKGMPYYYEMSEFAAKHNESIEFLSGDYHKDNYEDLYKQYEYYMDRVEHHSYQSTKTCTVEDTTIGYAPIQDKLNPKKENCERLQDAKKADKSLSLYLELENLFAFDKKDKEIGKSPYDYFIEEAKEGTTQFSPLSSETAHMLAAKLNTQYQNHTFHFETFHRSALLNFTKFMEDRTIHYIIFMMIIGLASIFAKEHQTHVKELTLTMKNGRSKLVYAKVSASLLYGISTFAILTLFTFIAHAIIYDLSIQKVSIQFFYYLQCTYLFDLLQYTLLYTGVLLLLTLSVTMVVSLLSSLCHHNYSAFLLSLCLLYGPVILYSSFMYMDVTRFSLVNTVNTESLFAAVSGIELGNLFIPTLPVTFIIYLFVIIVSLFLIRRMENRTPHHS